MSSELEQLMAQLSLDGSNGLAAVAEVAHNIASEWLSGERPVPADVLTMLRGLVAMHGGSLSG